LKAIAWLLARILARIIQWYIRYVMLDRTVSE